MAQNVYPTSTVSNTNWTGDHTAIDEGATPDDGDFVYSQDNPATTSPFEVHVGDPVDPGIHTGHIVRWRHALIDTGVLASSDGTGCDVTVYLYQGATPIANSGLKALDGIYSWTADSFTLEPAEAGNITNYSDLRIRWEADGGGGNPANRRGAGVSWAELEVPTPSGEVSEPVSVRIANVYEAELGLGTVTDPTVHTDHIATALVEATGTVAGDVHFKLSVYESTTLRGESGWLTPSETLAWYEYPLTTGEAAAITSYSTLRLRITVRCWWWSNRSWCSFGITCHYNSRSCRSLA
jgi:hypothetical protein